MSGEDTMEQREAVIQVAALAYQAGDFDEAIAFYTRALATPEDPRIPRFHFLLGECYQAKGETEQAITHWQAALKGSADLPFYAVALDRLGRAWQNATGGRRSPCSPSVDEFPDSLSARLWPKSWPKPTVN